MFKNKIKLHAVRVAVGDPREGHAWRFPITWSLKDQLSMVYNC